jgi:hypothetical protein
MDYIITTLPVRRLSFFISPLSLSLSLSLCIYRERETACVRESIDAGAMCCHLSPTWVGVLPVTLDRATTPKPSADRAFPGSRGPPRTATPCVRTYVRERCAPHRWRSGRWWRRRLPKPRELPACCRAPSWWNCLLLLPAELLPCPHRLCHRCDQVWTAGNELEVCNH